MSSTISIQRVSKRFRDCEALRQVSLEVPPGVVFALLGENGAGKTTLIQILTGFSAADEGSVTVLGSDPLSRGLSVRRQIGYVSDAPALYDWMTAARIGWFTAAFYPEGFLPRYDELLRHFEVPPLRKIKRMSKGQRAKVALALAIAHDPALLILDEPTSGLDPLVRRQFLESMVDRAATGQTVLLSSHQISEVERVADWVAILHEGAVRLVAPLSELKETIVEWVVTVRDPLVELARPDGELLSESRQGRQVRWLLRDVAAESLTRLQQHPEVVAVQPRTPTLEEIFIGCTHGTLPPLAEEPAASASPVG